MADRQDWTTAEISHVQVVPETTNPHAPTLVQCLISLAADDFGPGELQLHLFYVETTRCDGGQSVVSFHSNEINSKTLLPKATMPTARVFYTVGDGNQTVAVDRLVEDLSTASPRQLTERYDGTLAPCELVKLRRLLTEAAVVKNSTVGEYNAAQYWYWGTRTLVASWYPQYRQLLIQWPNTPHKFQIRWRHPDEDILALGKPADGSYPRFDTR